MAEERWAKVPRSLAVRLTAAELRAFVIVSSFADRERLTPAGLSVPQLLAAELGLTNGRGRQLVRALAGRGLLRPRGLRSHDRAGSERYLVAPFPTEAELPSRRKETARPTEAGGPSRRKVQSYRRRSTENRDPDARAREGQQVSLQTSLLDEIATLRRGLSDRSVAGALSEVGFNPPWPFERWTAEAVVGVAGERQDSPRAVGSSA